MQEGLAGIGRDSFMEGGKDLVEEGFVFLVVVGNRYIRYSWT